MFLLKVFRAQNYSIVPPSPKRFMVAGVASIIVFFKMVLEFVSDVFSSVCSSGGCSLWDPARGDGHLCQELWSVANLVSEHTSSPTSLSLQLATV